MELEDKVVTAEVIVTLKDSCFQDGKWRTELNGDPIIMDDKKFVFHILEDGALTIESINVEDVEAFTVKIKD